MGLRDSERLYVALGGTLYQDLPSQHDSKIEHHQKPPYDIPVHDVYLVKGTPLYNLVEKEKLSVNSYHHQAIKTIAPSLSVMATSIDNLVEGVYKKDKKFFGHFSGILSLHLKKMRYKEKYLKSL